MNSRTVIAVLLGIFWFLYPPKAYAVPECKQCKAMQLNENNTTSIKDWDTSKTTWDQKNNLSDKPIKVKKKTASTTPSTK